MATFTSETALGAVKLFKRLLWQHSEQSCASDVQIAAVIGTSSQQVANFKSEIRTDNFPAAFVPLLADREVPEVHAMGVGLLNDLAAPFGRITVEAVPVGSINGTLTDELTALLPEIGDLAKNADIPADKVAKLKRHIDRAQSILYAMRCEVTSKESRMSGDAHPHKHGPNLGYTRKDAE